MTSVGNTSIVAPRDITNASFVSSLASSFFRRSARKTYNIRGIPYEVEERYVVNNLLGRGAYGTVCSAYDSVLNKNVAIKRISHLFDDLVDARRVWREVSLLRLLRDSKARHILPIFRLLVPSSNAASFNELYIVTELYKSDLHQVIARELPLLKDATFRKVALQLLLAVYDMHRRHVIHRDLKPGNVLVDADKNLFICDFGLAKGGLPEKEDDVFMTDYMVTRWYRPPELLTMSKYFYPVDLWGIGCILAEYLRGKPLFMGHDYVKQMELIVSAVACDETAFIESPSAREFVQELRNKKSFSAPSLKTILSGANPVWIDLIEKLVVFNPASRLTAEQALRHPLFAGENVALGEPFPPIDFDFSLDAAGEISEARLRRKLVEEVVACGGATNPAAADDAKST